ncbi:hypothetical protein FRC02_010832 [Tulasnella sp. 418]|nr:hypothetical protein FRC02_010832 [Tulasnella sp. 418]
MLRGQDSLSPPDSPIERSATPATPVMSRPTEGSNKQPAAANARTSPVMPRKQQRILPNPNPQPSPPIIPSSSSSATSQSAASKDDTPPPIDQTTAPPDPPRRGRRPGSSSISKSAREAARKSNHSRIEKLRREKINDAMQALRDLVPYEDERPSKGNEEKEFKLEVLERTVGYLRKLKAKVADLEAAQALQQGNLSEPLEEARQKTEAGPHDCSKCAGKEPIIELDDQSGGAIDSEREVSTCEPASRRTSPLSFEAPKSHSIRLPPLSSLIQQQPYEPLSPPHSGRLRPHGILNGPPPSLDLPSAHASLGHRTPKSGSWTNDDESVASLLVQFSSTDRKPSSSAHTPSTLLGIKRPRKSDPPDLPENEGHQNKRVATDS